MGWPPAAMEGRGGESERCAYPPRVPYPQPWDGRKAIIIPGMSWISALEALALLLIAGSLLYFWRAARARSKVRAAEEVAWFEGRVRELRRRQDSLRARLGSAQALFDHYLNQ